MVCLYQTWISTRQSAPARCSVSIHCSHHPTALTTPRAKQYRLHTTDTSIPQLALCFSASSCSLWCCVPGGGVCINISVPRATSGPRAASAHGASLADWGRP